MDKVSPPEAARYCSCHPDSPAVVVQPALFQRDRPAPVLLTMTLAFTDDGWSLGGSLLELDTLEVRAQTAQHDCPGPLDRSVVDWWLNELLEATDLVRSPFGG